MEGTWTDIVVNEIKSWGCAWMELKRSEKYWEGRQNSLWIEEAQEEYKEEDDEWEEEEVEEVEEDDKKREKVRYGGGVNVDDDCRRWHANEREG